jgi:hypothetical protein
MFELVIESFEKVNNWLYGDFFKQKTTPDIFFFSWQSARPRKQKKKWRQASLLVNLLLSFLKIKKTWEFLFKNCTIFQFANWIHMEVPFISPFKIPEAITLPSFFAGGFFAELDEPG